MKRHVLLLVLVLMCYYSSLGQHNDLYLDKYESAFVDSRNAAQYSPDDEIDLKRDSNINYLDLLKNELATLNPKYVLLNKLKNIQHILAIDSVEFAIQKPSSFMQLNGSLSIEAYASDFQLPYSLSEPYYVRFYATPNVSLFGLPFQTDLYYTTESKSFYNSNNITFRFDIDAFKESSLDIAKKRVDAKKNQVKELVYAQEDIEVYKNDVSRVIRNMEQELESTIESQKKSFENLGDDTTGLAKQMKDRLNDAEKENKQVKRLQDSLSNVREKNADRQDSISQRILYLKAKLDKLRNYISVADSLQKKVEATETVLNGAVSAETMKIQSELEHRKNNKGNSLRDSVKNSNLGTFIGTIDEFDIGLSNPYFSKNTINNIPVKGVSIKKVGSNTKNYYTRLVAGKTMAAFTTGFENDNQPLFTRNVLGTKIGIGSEGMNESYLISTFFWDDKSISKPMSNLVNGFGWNNQLGKLKYEVELTHSIYHNGWTNTSSEKGVSTFAKLTDALSFSGGATYRFNKSSKIQFVGDQKNFGFRSMGSPFLRNDYRTIDGKYTQKWLKGKIQSVSFYKHFVGNLSNLSDITNRMKGFGINVQSNFRKYPNFMLAYTPFEQGNNHQDTLFRTNNKFKSLVAQLSYKRSFDRHTLYSVISVNRSIVEYLNQDGFKSNTTLLSFNQLYRNNKLSASLLFNRSWTEPGIDSLNYISLNSTIQYNLKGLHLLTSVNYKVTDSHGTFYSHSLGIKKQLSQSFIFETKAVYGYIDKIWGFENRRTRSIMCSVQYLFQ